jgi:hypothetical protein
MFAGICLQIRILNNYLEEGWEVSRSTSHSLCVGRSLDNCLVFLIKYLHERFLLVECLIIRRPFQTGSVKDAKDDDDEQSINQSTTSATMRVFILSMELFELQISHS